jgi:hypothetical protein
MATASAGGPPVIAIARVTLVVLLLVGPATAQQAAGPPDFMIVFRGYTLATKGAEIAAGVSIWDIPIAGKVATRTMSMERCGYFAASSGNEALADADVGWRLELTPIRVVDDAVTFRLRWGRVIDRLTATAGPPPGEDSELTLRVGESRPLDSVPVPRGAKTFDGKPCDKSLASVRVSVEPYPDEQFDRRLVVMDLWLVERRADNGEQTRRLQVRTLPNRSTSFYFDPVRAGDSFLDIFGRIVAKVDGTGVELGVETISRWDARPPAYPYRWLRSTVHVRPDEVVEIPLPKLGAEAGPFGDRSFSLRVKARRLQ